VSQSNFMVVFLLANHTELIVFSPLFFWVKYKNGPCVSGVYQISPWVY
jgi:hypothetical protein